MTIYVSETFITARNDKTGEVKSVPVAITSTKCDSNTKPTVLYSGGYSGKIRNNKINKTSN